LAKPISSPGRAQKSILDAESLDFLAILALNAESARLLGPPGA
jgi:hypothetical protein